MLDERIIIEIKGDPKVDLGNVASQLINKEIYANWPHIITGLVTLVQSNNEEYKFEFLYR